MKDFPSTPHINVLDEIGFGKTVLMPGDPLRSKLIAETFLETPFSNDERHIRRIEKIEE